MVDARSMVRGAAVKLTDVELVTLLGARYVFPDMPRAEMDALVERAKHGESCQSLTIHNASSAVLVMPWRIVATISYDGGVRWTRQSSAA